MGTFSYSDIKGLVDRGPLGVKNFYPVFTVCLFRLAAGKAIKAVSRLFTKSSSSISRNAQTINTHVNRAGKRETIKTSSESYESALKSFRKDVRNPRDHGNGVQTGQTSDGRTLTIRTRGNNGPTLDIKHPNGDVEKIRLQG